MLNADRKSDWEFSNSNTAGIGLAFLAGNGGTIDLLNPQKKIVQFSYATIGTGASYSIKIPNVTLGLGKGGTLPAGFVQGPSVLPNRDALYMTKQFKGKELTADDLRGTCACLDLSAGMGAGISLTAMALNLDLHFDAHTMFHQVLMPLVLGGPAAELVNTRVLGEKEASTGTAVLFMVAMTAGAQAGAGITGTIGYLK
jgi:hypothetical protein